MELLKVEKSDPCMGTITRVVLRVTGPIGSLDFECESEENAACLYKEMLAAILKNTNMRPHFLEHSTIISAPENSIEVLHPFKKSLTEKYLGKV